MSAASGGRPATGSTQWRRLPLYLTPALVASVLLASQVAAGRVPVVLAGAVRSSSGILSGPFRSDFVTVTAPSVVIGQGTVPNTLRLFMPSAHVTGLDLLMCVGSVPLGLTAATVDSNTMTMDAQSLALRSGGSLSGRAHFTTVDMNSTSTVGIGSLQLGGSTADPVDAQANTVDVRVLSLAGMSLHLGGGGC